MEVELVRPKTSIKLETVSRQLRQTLVHSAKAEYVLDPQFSPDGQRIVARSYPSGIVQVWQVETGNQLTRIETDAGNWSNWAVARDWTRVYVSRIHKNVLAVAADGGSRHRWDFDSNVRAWDLTTGELKDTFQFTPSRGIDRLCLSPDGTRLVTFEQPSGEYESRPPRTTSLWNVKTKQFRSLRAGLDGESAHFSADGTKLLTSQVDEQFRLVAWKVLDVKTGTEKLSLPPARQDLYPGLAALSPDGKLLAAEIVSVEPKQSWLKVQDIETGAQLISYEGDAEDNWGAPVFSPDGRTLVMTTFNSQPTKLITLDVTARKLSKILVLEDQAIVHNPTFSPDGRWLMVVTQVFPEDTAGRHREPSETPQARIHKIDVAAQTVVETLIAPQGFVKAASFSPDGKLFATGSTGKVLIWNLHESPADHRPD